MTEKDALKLVANFKYDVTESLQTFVRLVLF